MRVSALRGQPSTFSTSRPLTVLVAQVDQLALPALLLMALGLRLWGLGWGLPWAFHPDESNYVDRAQDMLTSGSPNPRYFENPSLLTYLIAGELLLVRAVGPLAFEQPATAYLLARLDSALLGTLTVLLVVKAGTRIFSRGVGLIAGLLLTVAFLHVRDSHYGVNDVPATALLLLSAYSSARLAELPSPRWYILAGLAGGLAISAKYSMGFFLVPLLAAHGLAHGRRAVSRANLGYLALAALLAILGFLLGTPYSVFDFERFRRDFLAQLGYGNTRWLGQSAEPVSLLYLGAVVQGFGALPFLLALAGLLAGALRTCLRRGAMLACAFPVAYLAFMVPKALFFPRFLVPVLPFLALLAALGLARLAGRWRWRLAGAVLGLSLLQPLNDVLRHDWLLTQIDTRVEANRWIQANLPAGSRLKVESYSLLDRSAENRTYTPNDAGHRIELFLSAPADDQYNQFLDKEVDYFVTSSFAFERFGSDAPARQESARRYQRFHRELDRRARLIATFGPGQAGAEVPYREEDQMTPFWHLEQYERTGPTIRIYALGRTL